MPIFLLYYDSDNWAYGSFYPDELQFTVRANGNEVQITQDLTPTADQEYVFAFRWTSALGELGLEPRTLSTFIDGVKGTDDQISEDILPASTGTLNIGTVEAGFGGYMLIPEPAIAISQIESIQRPLTDDEIAARP